ncbi:MAG: HAD family hydrolase [Actinophytocola sp.]|uniref:HAD family hydrolase n=1 Tax=Actinophytocola sp. TaxID=1872138 RepID=UPI003C770D1D
MTAEEQLTECDHVLLAFDGPVAELPSVAVADRLRTLLAEAELPRRVARTGDPFAVIAYAATVGPATERALYAHLRRVEFELTGGARVADGLHAALATLAAAGARLTVVSGLHVDAVRSFLVMHGLDQHIRHLAARTGPGAELPPAPDLVAAAVRDEECVFVGSTGPDLAAARAAGVTALRYRRLVAEELDEQRNPWFAALSSPSRRLM